MKKGLIRAYMFTILALVVLSTNALATAITTAVPLGGSYIAAQDVQLKTSELATVYCTTDGTVPQMTPDYICGTSIPVARDAVLTFFSVDNLGNVEQTKTETYVITGGELRAWGDNTNGQLGDGTTIPSSIPVTSTGFTDVISVKAGIVHSAALRKDGTVWTWGNNSSGQLGDGTTIARNTPVQVNGLTDVVSIAVGGSHTMALKRDGTVWAWGDNTTCQLGYGSCDPFSEDFIMDSSTPGQVSGLTDVVSVSAGYYFTVALKKDGTVWGWGENSHGQLGIGTPWFTPGINQAALGNVVSLSAGYFHTLALKRDGVMWAWGDNESGQLGSYTSGNMSFIPVPVGPLGPPSGITSISAGSYHSVALKDDGTVWAWGNNYDGQLGDGTTTYTMPVQVSGLTDAIGVSAGAFHTMALKQDGTTWAWGYNENGQLGDGTSTQRLTPVQVSDITNAHSISGGNMHSLALVEPTTGTFTITATAGPNGSISPSSAVEVNAGQSAIFFIGPDYGYMVADVIVDGASVGPVGIYTFDNVTGDHTISVTFRKPVITATAGPNGQIFPSGTVCVPTLHGRRRAGLRLYGCRHGGGWRVCGCSPDVHV